MPVVRFDYTGGGADRIITVVTKIRPSGRSRAVSAIHRSNAMKASSHVAVPFVAIALVLVCGPAAAAGPGAKLETDAQVLLDVKALTNELELTGEQQEDLKEIVKRLGATITAWDADNRAEYAEVQRAYSASLTSGNSSKMRQAMAARKALDRRRQYVIDKYKRRVRRLLTDEQQLAWKGYTLYREMLGRYRRWQLTSKQMEEIKSSCDAVVDMISALNTRGDIEGVMRTRTALQRHIVDEIFTEAQRKKIEAPPPMSREAREAAEKREAEAKLAFQTFINKQEIRQAYRSLKITQEMARLMVRHNIKKAEEARKNWNKKRTVRPHGGDKKKKKKRK